jgi:DNA-binding SARP family transcriptional activator/tetratricopeptide (TPR) repeat protein
LIELRTLGGIELNGPPDRDLRPILVGPKRLALLSYLSLATPRGFQRRDTLVGLFWPDLDQTHSRRALRNLVHELRTTLGPGVLINRGDDELGLDPTHLWCDAVVFDEAFDEDDAERASELYRGDLLEGFFVTGAPEFEFWLARQRERLHRRAVEAARRLSSHQAAAGNGSGAVRWARRARALAPDEEEPLRELVALLDRLGDRAAAVREYDEFERRLRMDLDLEPSPETRTLIGTIRTRGERSAPLGGLDGKTGLAEARDPASGQRRSHAISSPAARRPRWLTAHPILTVAAIVLVAVAAMAGVYLVRERHVARARGSDAPAPRSQVAGRGADGASTRLADLAADAAPAIAVLPFQVNDPRLDTWSEGMVDLLSADLDGVAGLRAIDSRTVLAGLREREDETSILAPPGLPTREVTLAVSSRAGARYAVLGGAVAMGSAVRIAADLYAVPSGERLAQLQVEGSPDSVFGLVDRLAVQLLRTILPREGRSADLARANLARVTTTSLPALKAYLEGETLYRRSEFQAAGAAYQRALDADSTFALALLRFAYPHAFLPSPPSGGDPLERVSRFLDRLAPREALIVQSALAFRQEDAERGARLLEQAAREYPDDAEIWYSLGETYLHLGGQLLVDRDESQRAFSNAIALDPAFTPPYFHLIEETIALHADSARAAKLIRIYEKLAPGSEFGVPGRLAFDLAWGDSAAQAQALSVLDTLPLWLAFEVAANLGHPRLLAAAESVRDVIARRAEAGERDARPYGFRAHVGSGRLSAAVSLLLEWEECPAPLLYSAYLLGKTGLPAGAQGLLVLSAASSSTCPGTTVFSAGAYAADRARWAVHDSARVRLRHEADRLLAAGDSVRSRHFALLAEALRGYGLARGGRTREALPILEAVQRRIAGGSNEIVRWWLGELLLKSGDPRGAERYLASFWHSGYFGTPADYHLGEIYEQEGRLQEALAAYDSFARAWRYADPELQGRVLDAKASVRRLRAVSRAE